MNNKKTDKNYYSDVKLTDNEKNIILNDLHNQLSARKNSVVSMNKRKNKFFRPAVSIALSFCIIFSAITYDGNSHMHDSIIDPSDTDITTIFTLPAVSDTNEKTETSAENSMGEITSVYQNNGTIESSYNNTDISSENNNYYSDIFTESNEYSDIFTESAYETLPVFTDLSEETVYTEGNATIPETEMTLPQTIYTEEALTPPGTEETFPVTDAPSVTEEATAGTTRTENEPSFDEPPADMAETTIIEYEPTPCTTALEGTSPSYMPETMESYCTELDITTQPSFQTVLSTTETTTTATSRTVPQTTKVSYSYYEEAVTTQPPEETY